MTQNVEFDPTFLLSILLKYFQTSFVDKRAKSIILFHSINAPKKVDLGLISPNWLDCLINIWMRSISQWQEEFLILLHSKSFCLRNEKYCLSEFGDKTMHYNARALATFFNKIILISIIWNKPIVDTDTTRLAFHLQASSFTHMALLAFLFIFIFSTLDLLCKLSWFLSKYIGALFFEALLYLSLHQNTYFFLLLTLSLTKIEVLP